MLNNCSIQTKLTILFIITIFFVIFVTNYFIAKNALFFQKEEIRKRLISIASMAALSIDGDEHEQILPKLSSLNSELHIKLNKNLRRIKKSCFDIKYVYTLVPNKSNIWKFIGDSDEQEPAPPGYKYDISSYPEMRIALKNASADRELSKDEWGTWLSGYAPIKNCYGKTIAIIGVDMSAELFNQLQFAIRKIFWIINFFGIILSILLAYFLSSSFAEPFKKLVEATNIIANGNFNYKIEEIKTNKEINSLIISFNTMNAKLNEFYQKIQDYFLNIIQSFVVIIEGKDRYLHGHLERVTDYAMKIAKELKISEQEITAIEKIVKLHDIGKISIADEILHKTSLLTVKDWVQIKKHVEIGEKILKPIKLTDLELSLIKFHHERFDGTGYPYGLKGEEIPLIARILGCADAFDSMNSDRVYRKALSKKDIIKELITNTNSQFDPKVVEAFFKIINRNEIEFSSK